MQKKGSRRRFISLASGAAAATMINPLAWIAEAPDPTVMRIVANTLGIDAHNHIDVPLMTSEVPGPSINLSAELKTSGLSAICMTFAIDYQQLNKPGEAYERFTNGIASMDQQLKANSIKRSLNLADLRKAFETHQLTVIQSVEGGHFLEGKLDRLTKAYERGLRNFCLLHDSDASVPLGDVFTNPVRWNGLTAFGADVIRVCNRLGILIDLAHANNATVNAALKITKHPVIISHTGLDTRLGTNANMAQMMRPRLISKEQANIVAQAGGVIGVWTHLSDSPLDYVQNIRAMVDVTGVDHVCIGTDTKLTPSYRSPGAGNPRPERIGERTNHAWPNQTEGFYYAVVDAMLKTGFSEDEIAKIGGGNFCRVFDAATS